jgi:predicted DNA-binding WGR domain protein
MQPWFISLPFLHLVDYTPRECYHSVRFEKESRYYVIRLSKDLLEDWVITLINGRIKSKLGQSRTLAFTDFNDGFDHFCTLAKTRHQRGYQLKNIFVDNHLLLNILPFLTNTENNNNLSGTKTGRKRNIQNSKLNAGRNHLPTSIAHQQMGFVF